MKKKKKELPHKTSINLAIREKKPNRFTVSAPLTLLIIALAVVFGKFAVADRLAHLNEKQQELARIQSAVVQLQEDTADYDEVAGEYSRYAASWMTEEEQNAADRLQAVELVQQELMAVARVERFSVAENVLSASLADVTLDATAALVQRLESLPTVGSVAVYTANNQVEAGKGTAVTMTITLLPAGQGGEQP